jgi:hypothetical protein
MSLRHLARIVLHLWLAMSLAMPAAAWVTPLTQTLNHQASVGSPHNSAGASIIPSTRVPAEAVQQTAIEEPRGASCHDAAQAAAVPATKQGQPTGRTAEQLDDHSDNHSDASQPNDCCDGGCDDHGCDRALCMHLAWLPRLGSSATPTTQSVVFPADTSSRLPRLSETPLRPPIASRR